MTHSITDAADREAGHYVDGEWVIAGDRADAVSPSTGEPIGSFVLGGAAQCDRAVAAARTAFEKGGWSNNPRRRAAALHAMADALEAVRPRLVPIAVAESGKRALEVNAEIDLAVSELRYYAGLARLIFGRVQEVGEGELSLFTREPIGVVAVIVPWNAPIALLARSLGPALAAGCTVVVKPAPQTSLTNAVMIRAFARIADLPGGVLGSVNENGSEVGRALVAHPQVDAVSFTGSRETAGHIMVSAAATMKRLNLELGGKAPAILFADADIDIAVEGVVRGATIGAGQQCTAVTRVLVDRRRADEVSGRLADRFASLRVGPADAAGSEMGPVIDRRSRDRLRDLAARNASRAIVLGEASEELPEGGSYVAPSLIAIEDPAEDIVQVEHFGPVITFETFDDEAEAMHKANATIYGLAASVWTRDAARAQRTARALRSGTVWINAHNRLFPEAETGGFKQSGLGRLHGATALDLFMETKHIFQAAPFLGSTLLHDGQYGAE